MQALILAGGEGTRLRPLTTTVPKPVVPLVDRPFIAFMLDWLRLHGVERHRHLVRPHGRRGAQRARRRQRVRREAALRRGADADGDRRRAQVRGVAARRPLLHAQRRRPHRPRPVGPARAARVDGRDGDARADAGRGPDELRPRAHGRATARSRSSSRSRPTTRSTRATSPPAPTSSSARCSTCSQPEQPASIERDVFPQLVGNGLYGCVSDNYWLDIGTPERYLQATFDILEGTVGTGVRRAGGRQLPRGRAVGRERGPDHPVGARRQLLADRRRRARGRPGRARAERERRAEHDDRALRRAARAPRSARTARSAAASSAAACGSATTRTSRACRCSARASRSAPTT